MCLPHEEGRTANSLLILSICGAQGYSWDPEIAGYLFEYVENKLTK